MSYIRVIDDRLKAVSEDDIKFVIKEGAQTTAYVPLQASSTSNQQTNWNLNNIADRTCRDSRLACFMTVALSMNITSTGAGSAINTSGNFGFKQWPINRCISNIQHQINQASYSLNTNQIIDSITRFNLCPENCDFYDNTQPDFIGTSYAAAAGSNFNPLIPYTSTIAGDGVYKPRSNNYIITGGNTFAGAATQNVTLTAYLYEPLISPFNNVGAKNIKGLYAINGEIIQVQWVTDLFNNMFAYAIPSGWTLNSTTVTLGSSTPSSGISAVQPALDCIYLTPQPSFMKEIPQESVYHYNNYSVFVTQALQSGLASTTYVPGGSGGAQVTSQVCNFTNVPQKVIVYCKPRVPRASQPDFYTAITNVSIQFDNGQPQLSAATPNQLYDVSRRNGLSMPRDCFLQTNLAPSFAAPIPSCGSVLILDPVMDFGVRDGLTNSSGGRFIFQITLNVANYTGTNITDPIDLYVVSVNDSILERVGNEYRNYLVTMPDNAFELSKNLPAIDHAEYMEALEKNMFLSGGSIKSFFRKLWHGVKHVGQFAYKHRDTIIPIAKKAYELYGKGADRNSQFNRAIKKDMHKRRDMDMFYE